MTLKISGTHYCCAFGSVAFGSVVFWDTIPCIDPEPEQPELQPVDDDDNDDDVENVDLDPYDSDFRVDAETFWVAGDSLNTKRKRWVQDHLRVYSRQGDKREGAISSETY